MMSMPLCLWMAVVLTEMRAGEKDAILCVLVIFLPMPYATAVCGVCLSHILVLTREIGVYRV